MPCLIKIDLFARCTLSVKMLLISLACYKSNGAIVIYAGSKVIDKDLGLEDSLSYKK